MTKANARPLPGGAVARPTHALDIAAIVVRNAIPIIGIVAFGWSAVQFLVLSVFNLAMSIVNIGLAGAIASTMRGDGAMAARKVRFGELMKFLGAGVFLAVLLTTMGAWPIFVIAEKDAGVLLRPGFWGAVLAIVIVSVPSVRAEIHAKLMSPLTLEQSKARDQPRVGIAFFGIGVSLVMSGWAAQFGSFGLVLLVIGFTAFALVRELRPDWIANGLNREADLRYRLRMDAICANCAHFNSDPRAVEAATPGLSALSSGFASVRSSDGLCDVHDRHVPAHATCVSFAAKSATP